MALFSEIWFRLTLAVAASFLLSQTQYRFFDCNKMPVLSLVSGAATCLLLYAIGEILYRVGTSPLSSRDKLRDGTIFALVGAGLVATAGFFTMITHLCP